MKGMALFLKSIQKMKRFIKLLFLVLWVANEVRELLVSQVLYQQFQQLGFPPEKKKSVRIQVMKWNLKSKQMQ